MRSCGPRLSSQSQCRGARAQAGTFSALSAALADPAVDVVEITQPIDFTSQITISRSVTVRGIGGAQTLDGGSTTRLFSVASGATVTFSNLVFQNVRTRSTPLRARRPCKTPY